MIEYKRKLQQCIDKKSYPNVQLTVVSSATLQKGQKVLLNPLGLCSKNERSLREISQDGVQMPQDQQQATQLFASLAPDGFTYFGSLPDVFEDDDQEDFMAKREGQ